MRDPQKTKLPSTPTDYGTVRGVHSQFAATSNTLILPTRSSKGFHPISYTEKQRILGSWVVLKKLNKDMSNSSLGDLTSGSCHIDPIISKKSRSRSTSTGGGSLAAIHKRRPSLSTRFTTKAKELQENAKRSTGSAITVAETHNFNEKQERQLHGNKGNKFSSKVTTTIVKDKKVLPATMAVPNHVVSRHPVTVTTSSSSIKRPSSRPPPPQTARVEESRRTTANSKLLGAKSPAYATTTRSRPSTPSATPRRPGAEELKTEQTWKLQRRRTVPPRPPPTFERPDKVDTNDGNQQLIKAEENNAADRREVVNEVDDAGLSDGSSTERRQQQRSRSIRREVRRRREQSANRAAAAAAAAAAGNSDPNMPVNDDRSRTDSSERRMAKYKEERRRQLASQVASRILTAKEGSSSSEEEDNNSGGSNSRREHESFSKYRRRRRKNKEGSVRSKSPEHIYQQIGSELSLTSPPRSVHRNGGDMVHNNSPPVPSPRKVFSLSAEGRRSLPPQPLSSSARNSFQDSISPGSSISAVDKGAKRKSMLNTSYSSEEILMQAASELQDIGARPYGHSADSSNNGLRAHSLSSPEMIKSASRTFTPQMCPRALPPQPSERRPRHDEPTSPELPLSPGSGGTAGKPPIFPTAEHVSRSGGGLKIALRKTSEGPSFLRKDAPTSDAVSVPPFVKEFAGVVRRRSSFNPNESAPPPPSVSPRTERPLSSSVFDKKPATATTSNSSRRKSDFMARYEELANRASAALHLADHLQKDSTALLSPEEPEDVEFNEEEVLKTCQEFQEFVKDYDNSRRRQSLCEDPLNQQFPLPIPTASPNPPPTVRNRSSSLTYLDKRSPNNSEAHTMPDHDPLPKPILKKSSEDLSSFGCNARQPVPILKHKDSDSSLTAFGGGILKKKGSEDCSSSSSHVRILSPVPTDHGPRRPILRSRTNSTCDDRASSPDPQSILKRRSSIDDLDLDGRLSPEPPQGILKRKYSGSAGTSGSHSPCEVSLESKAIISSILKKQGSLDDMDPADERIKSILKKHQQSQPCSTDDELDENVAAERPRSILKSRKSEESLSPLSDANEVLTTMVVPRRAPPVVEDSKPRRPILKRKDSREELLVTATAAARSRTLSPSSDESELNSHHSASRYREVDSLTPRSSVATTHSGSNRDSSGSFASGLHSPQLDRNSKRESGLSLTDSYKTAESEQEAERPMWRSVAAAVRASPRSEPESSGYETPPVNSMSRGADRSRDSPRKQRSQTQPITNQDLFASQKCEEKTNDPCKLSLAERVKLFDWRSSRTDSAFFSSSSFSPPPSSSPPMPPRQNPTKLNSRRRRQMDLASRFQTQPITVDEVQEASRNMFSLAASRVVGRPAVSNENVTALRNFFGGHGSNSKLSDETQMFPAKTGETVEACVAEETSTISQISVGILKRKGSWVTRGGRDQAEFDSSRGTEVTQASGPPPQPRKRSILKHDSFENPERLMRGVLKKDSSYDCDETPRPILKNPEEATAAPALPSSQQLTVTPDTPSSSSSEDLCSGVTLFSDVVIDPIPGSKRDCQQQLPSVSVFTGTPSSRKHSLKDRVILPHNISSDDRNLARKLEQLALEADTIRNKRQQEKQCINLEEEKAKEIPAKRNVESRNVKRIQSQNSNSGGQQVAPSSRKTSKDLDAEDYYKIFKGQCKGNIMNPVTDSKCDIVLKNNTFEEVIVERKANITDEKENLENNALHKSQEVNAEDKKKGPDRLAALQKSEENWMKKVATDDPMPDIRSSPVVQLRKNKVNGHQLEPVAAETTRPISIVDRLNNLQVAQTSWNSKVGEKDATKFTVAGKMEQQRKVLSEIPKSSPECLNRALTITEGVKMTPKLRIVTRKAVNGTPIMTPVSSEGDLLVNVPVQDEEALVKFFGGAAAKSPSGGGGGSSTTFEVDLDSVLRSPTESMLTVPKRASRAAVQSRRKSRNPVKHLAERKDLLPGYKEVSVVTEDAKRLNLEKIDRMSKHSHLAVEALAALASKEDFANIQLRKGDNRNQDLVPYQSLMLLQVKGRRCCQTRLVEPKSASVNSGDAYVLVTPKEVYNWQGRFSNVIERSRSAEVALMIIQKRDLGCKLAKSVCTIVEEENSSGTTKAERDFWRHLGEPSARPAGPPEEDEEFEAYINELNMIWEVDKEELVPLTQHWGLIPKFEALDTAKVLVIDFGSELYVWNGKSALFELRRTGVNLARQVWEDGFDYSGARKTNPLLGTKQIKGPRPAWGLFCKVNQHMETVLFREKFVDWPGASRVITKIKGLSEEEKSTTTGEISFKSFDAREMASWKVLEPNLHIEGSPVGRGSGYYDKQERRHYQIQTVSVKSWHVSEYDICALPDTWKAQFHAEDTYVFRWIYKVSLTGRSLKGCPSKHTAVGRDRCAYFFWQGSQSKMTEKGTSALMTVKLDEERGPQIRVDQGREEAAFLGLWSGRMTVHRGSRSDGGKEGSDNRLFIVRGETKEEACAVETDCEASSLRSLASLLLVCSSEVFLWHGASVPSHSREVAKSYADRLVRDPPSEMNFKNLARVQLSEEFEGCESRNFTRILKPTESAYVASYSPPLKSPRLYHMTSVSGRLHVTEILCPFRKIDVPLNPLAFNQSDLYSAEQPALFLLDTGCHLWLWQGWWPQGHDENDTNTVTGSGLIRWHAERRAAMKTCVDYRHIMYGDSQQLPPAKLVWAGCETLEFTNLFPTWTPRKDVAELNKQFVTAVTLEKTLDALSKSEYSWNELQQRPLPDGVDPAKLENYLSDEEFQRHLGLTREEFQNTPRWRQLEIRKEKGLF